MTDKPTKEQMFDWLGGKQYEFYRPIGSLFYNLKLQPSWVWTKPYMGRSLEECVIKAMQDNKTKEVK